MTASDQRDMGDRARAAVGLALVAVVTLVMSFGLFGLVWATNGSADRVEGLVGVGYLGGVLVSLVAFGLAVSVRVGRGPDARRRWTPLWLPLCVFPMLLAVWLLALIQEL